MFVPYLISLISLFLICSNNSSNIIVMLLLLQLFLCERCVVGDCGWRWDFLCLSYSPKLQPLLLSVVVRCYDTHYGAERRQCCFNTYKHISAQNYFYTFVLKKFRETNFFLKYFSCYIKNLLECIFFRYLGQSAVFLKDTIPWQSRIFPFHLFSICRPTSQFTKM